jgi:hypothetical protein
MLDAQITEWRDTVKDAGRELALLWLARRQGQPGVKLTDAEDKAGLELDCARQDLATLEEAQQLLSGLAAHLDDAGRATLALRRAATRRGGPLAT